MKIRVNYTHICNGTRLTGSVVKTVSNSDAAKTYCEGFMEDPSVVEVSWTQEEEETSMADKEEGITDKDILEGLTQLVSGVHITIDASLKGANVVTEQPAAITVPLLSGALISELDRYRDDTSRKMALAAVIKSFAEELNSIQDKNEKGEN